jgi:hypothetical protein
LSRLFCIVDTAGVVLLATAVGRAEPPNAARSAPPGDYSYRFLDDPLTAGGINANDAPRTAFIVEMLKTVESL